MVKLLTETLSMFVLQLDTCEQIVRDLLLHEDSWPFAQPVNLREVRFGCFNPRMPRCFGKRMLRKKINHLTMTWTFARRQVAKTAFIKKQEGPCFLAFVRGVLA